MKNITIETINVKENKYWVHFDEENQLYWIGYNTGQFIQQIGENIQYKKVAIRKAHRYNLVNQRKEEV